MPRTKIVCTIGPASGSCEVIKALIHAGMNVARLNFSHGTHSEHLEKIRIIRQASEEAGRPVAILQDLCGPKIRVGKIRGEGIRLEAEQFLTLTNEAADGSDNRVSVSYADLPREVKAGDHILLADGVMELVVRETTGTDIKGEVVIGGILTSNKGINLPSGTIKAPALTDKDRDDLAFGLSCGVDYVAMSFVRTANDVRDAKDIIRAAGKKTPVIAKIEKHEALENIDDIIEMSDGIMVARGDLGVEIPLERVPGIQKMLIEKTNTAGKPVIIATQMLRSMVTAIRPTRAEATDVANGVLDGADAVMLSEETASGQYPIEAVRVMTRIIEQAETNYPHERHIKRPIGDKVAESVAHASCVLADHLGAAAILATTKSGSTAVNIARFRPRTRVIALSPDSETVRRLALNWGCFPSKAQSPKDVDDLFDRTTQTALESGMVKKGDLVVITAGHPLWQEGTTNMLKVIRL